jgi:hypothetical protein
MFRLSVFEINGAAQQINGRECETVTFLSNFYVKSELCAGGFAPRHLICVSQVNIQLLSLCVPIINETQKRVRNRP